MNENEIRITAQGRMRNYISYALTLLQEKGSNDIVFKAMGRAINKTVAIAELIKRRVEGLHQLTSIGSIDITDTWEPLEEGLLPLETTRHVSVISITLSKSELDKGAAGYQSPLPSDHVKPLALNEYEGDAPSPNRGRGRGGRGRGRARGNGGNNTMEYGNEGYEMRDDGYDRGGYRRGRGRAYRGRGRGGRRSDFHQDFDGYDDESYAPPRGRGRGRGQYRGRGRGRRGRSNAPNYVSNAEE